MHVYISSKTALELIQESDSCDLICTWGFEQRLGGMEAKTPLAGSLRIVQST